MSENRNVDIWIAGAFAAFTVDLVIYPLDTVKTRLQSPDFHRLYMNSDGKGLNRSMFRGVYQGVGSVILATLPSSGAFFTTYEGLKGVLQKRNHSKSIPSSIVHAVASSVAELVSCAILTPAEVIKQNAQMYDNSKPGEPRMNATIAALKKFRANPIFLWRGYTALAGRNLPFTALQFPLLERIKQSICQYKDRHNSRTNTVWENILITATSAGVGGSIAAIATTPVDVIKTRIMLTAAEHVTDNKKSGERELSSPGATNSKVTKSPGHKSTIEIAKEIMNEHGVKGLFRGGALRAIWTMVGAALYLGMYEGGRIYLARQRGDSISVKDIEK